MNKYIKKCLVIYSALALMLVGMVGVTYAITATDADNYVTRSQYAVDMAHLQNKLDEKEAGLMGTLNRYRSTDVKFVTYDTPTKYCNSTDSRGGYYNGGNYWPHKPMANTAQYLFSPRTAGITDIKSNGTYGLYQLYRLYNGNYMFSKVLTYYPENSTGNLYVPCVIYALPVENFSGWYLINRLMRNAGNYIRTQTSLVRLDQNSPYSELDLYNKTIRVRFKSEFFTPGTYNSALPVTGTRTISTHYWENVNYMHPFLAHHDLNIAQTNSSNITYNTRLESETGDYIVELTGVLPWTGPNYVNREYNLTGDNYYPASRLIPKDNVEYVISPQGPYVGAQMYPDPEYIGTGNSDDRYWRHEFVDCVNGIKYWHAVRSPDFHTANDNIGTFHCCLPILY